MKLTTERRTHIMKAAHMITKLVIEYAESKNVNNISYSATLSESLKEVYKEYRTDEKAISKRLESGKTEEQVSWAIVRNILRKFNENFDKVERNAKLIVREMHYSEYKNDYQAFVTIKDSYNSETKTIKVYINLAIGNVLITDPAQEAYYKNYYKKK